jgi:hypothetical protein
MFFSTESRPTKPRTNSLSSALRLALGWAEELGIHAARHQAAGPTRGSLKQRAEFGIGREEHRAIE